MPRKAKETYSLEYVNALLTQLNNKKRHIADLEEVIKIKDRQIVHLQEALTRYMREDPSIP